MAQRRTNPRPPKPRRPTKTVASFGQKHQVSAQRVDLYAKMWPSAFDVMPRVRKDSGCAALQRPDNAPFESRQQKLPFAQ